MKITKGRLHLSAFALCFLGILLVGALGSFFFEFSFQADHFGFGIDKSVAWFELEQGNTADCRAFLKDHSAPMGLYLKKCKRRTWQTFSDYSRPKYRSYVAHAQTAIDRVFGDYPALKAPVSTYYLQLPAIPIVCVVAITILALFARSRARKLEGHCSHCRYCLTGNTTGICPECGTPVAPACS
ncbi:MAG TPA: hypothetical protein VMV81_13710 [Phycisphaerae bacterium]|nr:hypothetical protein [Phycisphaerae bacterium]